MVVTRKIVSNWIRLKKKTELVEHSLRRTKNKIEDPPLEYDSNGNVSLDISWKFGIPLDEL